MTAFPSSKATASGTWLAAVEFLDNAPGRPFFLSVGFSETHRRFHEPGPAEDPRFCLPAPTVPDTPETRADMAAFKASARVYDQGVGQVLDALDRNGLRENTLVINTTDHGIAFPGMKCTLTDHGIGIMLIMRGPDGFEGGKVIDAMVSHIDIFPTLCDLLDIDPPERLEGTSFMPLVRGEADEVNEEIHAEVSFHAAYEPMRCVRTRRWKYIKRFDGRDRPVLPNCDNSPSKDAWMEHGWPDRPVDEEQLYDLAFDPGETANRANDPNAAHALADMRRRLEKWMKDTDDPLLEGDVPGPSGAKVNNPDDVSPGDPTTTFP
jgi:arylsulfatase A-like enzyme